MGGGGGRKNNNGKNESRERKLFACRDSVPPPPLFLYILNYIYIYLIHTVGLSLRSLSATGLFSLQIDV